MKCLIDVGRQPNAYAVYRFFDFADHDTEIIASSACPEFNDVHTYPVVIGEDLDNYLKTSVSQCLSKSVASASCTAGNLLCDFKVQLA